MAKLTWRQNAELIGIAAIVASLVLVAYELRQNSEFAAAEEVATRYLAGIDAYAMLAENSELAEIYSKSCGSDDHLLTDAERVQLASFWMRVFYLTQWNIGTVPTSDIHLIVASQRSAHWRCKSYRQTFEQRRDEFAPEFVEFMDREIFGHEE